MASANSVAGALTARGIGEGDCVGLLLPRSMDAVVVILGVLRSGAAFVPLDAEYPDAQIDTLIADFGSEHGGWVISAA